MNNLIDFYYLIAGIVLLVAFITSDKKKKIAEEKPILPIIQDYRKINDRIQAAYNKAELDECLADINSFAARYAFNCSCGMITTILLDTLNVKLYGGEVQASTQ